MSTGRLDPDCRNSQMFEWGIGTYFISNWRMMEEQLKDEIYMIAEKLQEEYPHGDIQDNLEDRKVCYKSLARVPCERHGKREPDIATTV